MAIEFVGGASANNGGELFINALTGGIDTAAREGDLVIYANAIASASNMSYTTPTGFTQIGDLYANGSVDANLQVCYRLLPSSPQSSIVGYSNNTATNGHASIAMVFRGVDPTLLVDSYLGATGTGTGVANPPIVVTNYANSMVVAIGTCATTTAGGYTNYPSGYSGAVASNGGATRQCAIAGVYMVRESLGVEDPGTFSGVSTASSSTWAAFTLALAPLPDAPTLQTVNSGFFALL